MTNYVTQTLRHASERDFQSAKLSFCGMSVVVRFLRLSQKFDSSPLSSTPPVIFSLRDSL